MSGVAVRATDLSKRFRLHQERRRALKELVVRGRPPKPEEFWALQDASFEIPTGSTFGLIGHNGSGKSTALKVIAGIYRPTRGKVEVNGVLSALLELGAGFHPELTGRENVQLNGTILGLSRKQIDSYMEDIIEFSGMAEFIDVPVKFYSSGMYVRLGFAIAVKVDPEILVIDEVIAVGDEDFQRKCFEYIHDLRRRGSTIIIVSHSMGLVEDLCDQVMWLDRGRVAGLGPAREVVHSYLGRVNEAEEERAQVAAAANPPSEPVGPPRRGSGEVITTELATLDAAGTAQPFAVEGEEFVLRLQTEARVPVTDAVASLTFINDAGVPIAGCGSGAGGPLTFAPGRDILQFRAGRLPLRAGQYQVVTTLSAGGHTYDEVYEGFPLVVRGSGTPEPGLVGLSGGWQVLPRAGPSE